MIQIRIISEHYFLDDASVECLLVLNNGFVISGTYACPAGEVDVDNGRRIARQDAIRNNSSAFWCTELGVN